MDAWNLFVSCIVGFASGLAHLADFFNQRPKVELIYRVSPIHTHGVGTVVLRPSCGLEHQLGILEAAYVVAGQLNDQRTAAADDIGNLPRLPSHL